MGKLLIVSHKDDLLSLEYEQDRLSGIRKIDKQEDFSIGDIYIGRISKVMSNPKACFVDIAKNYSCYLPLSNVVNPIIINRNYDGRLLQGDFIIVQIEKSAIKTKQPVLTTKLSISGRYVIMENIAGKLGISNKLSQEVKDNIIVLLNNSHLIEENKYLLDAHKQVLPFSAIVRTNAGTLKNTTDLLKEWITNRDKLYDICNHNGHLTPYTCLYKASDPLYECLKYYYDKDIGEIVTDIPEVFSKLKENEKISIPVRFYEDEYSLKKLYQVDTEIKKTLQSHIWLKSGAYLVLEYTEALTVIDVNSGKKQSHKDFAQSTLEINMEAAKEILHQLKLRNISGMILIDFINMDNEAHEIKLMKFLNELAKKDPVQTNVLDITKLGLVEMTRKRIGRPIKEFL